MTAVWNPITESMEAPEAPLPPDEERDETAQRLLRDRVVTVMYEERRLRKRVELHARYLSEEDREFLRRYLLKQRELTCMRIEDISEESPDFDWPGEL